MGPVGLERSKEVGDETMMPTKGTTVLWARNRK